nr:BrnT family toxin [Polymorphobacter sp.]
MHFEYDPAKSVANAEKHGIDFIEAQDIWQDEKNVSTAARIGPDGEVRRLVIGLIGEKLWSAVVTERGESVRIISVRRARGDEREYYNSGGV